MVTPSRSRFPTGGEYGDALQNTRLRFPHSPLKGAAPGQDGLGRPRPTSGNFASVFSLPSVSGHRFAVKCFTREVPDQERRYKAISDHLSRLNHAWKVGFEYLPEGVMVGGARYPVLKMQWAEG